MFSRNDPRGKVRPPGSSPQRRHQACRLHGHVFPPLRDDRHDHSGDADDRGYGGDSYSQVPHPARLLLQRRPIPTGIDGQLGFPLGPDLAASSASCCFRCSSRAAARASLMAFPAIRGRFSWSAMWAVSSSCWRITLGISSWLILSCSSQNFTRSPIPTVILCIHLLHRYPQNRRRTRFLRNTVTPLSVF